MGVIYKLIKSADLFNDIPVVDAAERVFFIFGSIDVNDSRDHPFSQCRVYYGFLIVSETHD